VLTADQVKHCKKALKALEKKLGRPDALAKEFWNLPVPDRAPPPPRPLVFSPHLSSLVINLREF
jgi:hypothetical protein